MRIYHSKFEPIKVKKIASLVIIHGFGEHSSRFIEFSMYFILRGYVVHMIDLRGFG